MLPMLLPMLSIVIETWSVVVQPIWFVIVTVYVVAVVGATVGEFVFAPLTIPAPCQWYVRLSLLLLVTVSCICEFGQMICDGSRL